MSLRNIILFTISVFSSLTAAAAQEAPVLLGRGGIEGHVISVDGDPVEGAEVFSHEVSRLERPAPVYTDASGHFVLTNAPEGENIIYAHKEQEGYPLQFFSFYSDGPTKLPRVTVRAGEVSGGVIVRLGPKWGKLAVRCVDAQSGELVADAYITLSRGPNRSVGTDSGLEDGQAEFLAPPVPFEIELTARNYSTWRTRSPGVKTGETLNVTAPLRRQNKPSVNPKTGQTNGRRLL